MEIHFLAIWAAQGSQGKKELIMNYEQLFSLVFSCFHGQKNNLTFF
jgi:hypothetical protein